MAWTSVEEAFGQDWGDDTSGQGGIRIYKVVSDTAILDNNEVLLANDGSTAIPVIGAAWSISKSGVTVIDRRVKELDPTGKKFFQVAVRYQSPTGTGTTGSDDPDPTARPWDISSGTLKVEKNIEKTLVSAVGFLGADINLGLGVSIVNAASDPIEAREFKRNTVLTLSKNYSSFTDINAAITSLSALKAYEGKMNDTTGAPITIADIAGEKWTFLIDELNVVNARENEIDYIRVTYRLIYDVETHIEVLLNAGFNKLVTDGGDEVRVVINDAKGKPKQQPSLLTTTGTEVPAVGGGVATGTYIGAGLNAEIDFANLGLPTSFN